MGEIAEAIIDGDLCEICGVYLGDGDGHPRKCEGCDTWECPVCGAEVKKGQEHVHHYE